MPEDDTKNPIDRIHERLDDLFAQIAKIDTATTVIAQRCVPCQALVEKLNTTVYGNGQPGLVSRVTANEVGKVDTLSVKSVIAIITAVGTLAGAMGAAMGALVK